jgi:hypothetical protein
MPTKTKIDFTFLEIYKIVDKLLSYDVTLQWRDVKVCNAQLDGWQFSYDCVFDARDYNDLAITKQGTGQIWDGFSTIEFYDKERNVIATYDLPPRCIPASTLEDLKLLVQKEVDKVLSKEYRQGILLGYDCLKFILRGKENFEITGSKSVFTNVFLKKEVE